MIADPRVARPRSAERKSGETEKNEVVGDASIEVSRYSLRVRLGSSAKSSFSTVRVRSIAFRLGGRVLDANGTFRFSMVTMETLVFHDTFRRDTFLYTLFIRGGSSRGSSRETCLRSLNLPRRNVASTFSRFSSPPFFFPFFFSPFLEIATLPNRGQTIDRNGYVEAVEGDGGKARVASMNNACPSCRCSSNL